MLVLDQGCIVSLGHSWEGAQLFQQSLDQTRRVGPVRNGEKCRPVEHWQSMTGFSQPFSRRMQQINRQNDLQQDFPLAAIVDFTWSARPQCRFLHGRPPDPSQSAQTRLRNHGTSHRVDSVLPHGPHSIRPVQRHYFPDNDSHFTATRPATASYLESVRLSSV